MWLCVAACGCVLLLVVLCGRVCMFIDECSELENSYWLLAQIVLILKVIKATSFILTCHARIQSCTLT